MQTTTRNKVRWGVLGVASIAVRRAIPGMQRGEWSEVAAIASRDLRRAEDAARQLGIAKAYGSYEELLGDPEIEAIPGEVRQLVANLLSNSIDAVDNGGRIRIRVSAATGTGGANLLYA